MVYTIISIWILLYNISSDKTKSLEACQWYDMEIKPRTWTYHIESSPKEIFYCIDFLQQILRKVKMKPFLPFSIY